MNFILWSAGLWMVLNKNSVYESIWKKARSVSCRCVVNSCQKHTEQGRAGDSERQRRVIRKFQLIKQPLKLHSSSLWTLTWFETQRKRCRVEIHLKWAWSCRRMIHKKKKNFYKCNQILRRFIYGLFLQHVIGKVKVMHSICIEMWTIKLDQNSREITRIFEIIVKLTDYFWTMCFHEKFWSC